MSETLVVDRGTGPLGNANESRPARVGGCPAICPNPTISVVIPTLNEARNITDVLSRLPADVTEVIIVDGHSTDATVEAALTECPQARIVNQDGFGKGNALGCGIRMSTGDITVLLDADGSTDPAEIPRFTEALVDGYDFAKGTRFAVGGGSEDITRIRRIGNRILVGVVNKIWDVRFTDLCYGYNAFWTRHARTVHAPCNGFEVETLMNIRAASAKELRIVEVPSFEASRRHGVSNLSASRDGIRVLRTILAEWLRPA
jgi:glycosyltransferase involved in cell wall biosynthesis